MATPVLHPRYVLDQLHEALGDTPVVALNGARQVGKSTLVAQMLSRPGGAELVTLDDLTQRAAAYADPHTFVRRDGLLSSTRFNGCPTCFPPSRRRWIAIALPDGFLLTGSARLLSIAEMSASLAGRVEIIDLWPLSRGELRGQREGFVDTVFAWDPALLRDRGATREDCLRWACAGGYPEPQLRSGKRRHAWFSNYAATVVERMVSDVADVERLAAMPRLLRICAARTANELNVRDVADDLGLPYRTVGSYLTHLQNVFLLQLLPAWSRNLTSKVVRRPKVLISDSGLAAHLLGVDADALQDPTAPSGRLLETFAAMELRKQLAWAEVDASMFHFGDRGGAEVDLVLESRQGHVVAIEVKASATARSDDFRGLRLLADRLGNRFAGGVVAYTGNRAVPFGDRLAAIPLGSFWETA